MGIATGNLSDTNVAEKSPLKTSLLPFKFLLTFVKQTPKICNFPFFLFLNKLEEGAVLTGKAGMFYA